MVVVFVCMGLWRLTFLTLTLIDRSLAHLSDSLIESSTQSHFAPNTAILLTDSYLARGPVFWAHFNKRLIVLLAIGDKRAVRLGKQQFREFGKCVYQRFNDLEQTISYPSQNCQ